MNFIYVDKVLLYMFELKRSNALTLDCCNCSVVCLLKSKSSFYYTGPHFQRKMFLGDDFNSGIFKTKFGVVKSINVHDLPAHTSQLTILPRFTEHWYVRSKPVLLRCTCNHGIFLHLSVHEVYDTGAL